MTSASKHRWTQAAATVGYVAAVGAVAVAAGPALGIGAAFAATFPWLTAVGGVGQSLAAAGIQSLCQKSDFGEDQQQTDGLLSSDIARMVKTAVSEAARDTVHGWAAQNGGALPDLVRGLQGLSERDFQIDAIPEREVGRWVADAQREFMSASDGAQRVSDLNTAMLEALAAGAEDRVVERLQLANATHLPESLRQKFRGALPLLVQAYVGLYLKTNVRAQTAVQHFTLRGIADGTAEVARNLDALSARLCSNLDSGFRTLAQRFEASAKETALAVEDAVNRAFQKQDQPPLSAPFYSFEASNDVDRLVFGFRSSPLLGREETMGDLIDFVGEDPEAAKKGLKDVRWTTITGDTGCGKTRLAAELAFRLGGPAMEADSFRLWRAGFLDDPAGWLRDAGRRWIPDTDTLILIDYAGRVSGGTEEGVEALRNFLCDLARRSSEEKWYCRVRIVLIDRFHPDTQQQGLAVRLDAGDKGPLVKKLRWQSKRLHLGVLEAPDSLAVARAYGRHGAWTAQVEEAVRRAMLEDPELARPLFAAMLGQQAGSGVQHAGTLNAVTVAQKVLKRFFSHLPESGEFESAKDVLAVATAGQGMELTAVLERLELGTPVRRALVKMARIGSNDRLVALQPDFLGELLVLDRMALKPKLVSEWMGLAWELGGNTGQFVERLAEDFAGRAEQLSAAVNNQDKHVRKNDVESLPLEVLRSCLDGPDRWNYLPSVIFACMSKGGPRLGRMLIEAAEERQGTGSALPASVMAEAWLGYGLETDLEHRSVSLDKLDVLHNQHPEPTVREYLAMGLVNHAINLARVGDLAGAGNPLDQLVVLHNQHPEPAVREHLASGLFNLAHYLAQAGDLAGAGNPLDQLVVLHDQHPEPAVRENLAMCLFSRANYLAEAGDLAEAGALLDKMRRLHRDHSDEPPVREWLTRCLLNGANYLAEGDRAGEAEAVFAELQEIRRVHGVSDEVDSRARQVADAVGFEW